MPYQLPDSWRWVRLGEMVDLSENLNIHKELDKNTIISYLDIESIDKGFNSPSLTMENFKNTPFPLPPLAEQEEIVKILESLLQKEEKIQELLSTEKDLELLEKSILAKAFRGEFNTQSDEDEPAIELLTRILKEKI